MGGRNAEGTSLVPTVKTYGHDVAYSLKMCVAKVGVRMQQ
jgi:hypothetical protein